MARVAVSVAHRVEARKVAERLAGTQHVVGTHGSLRVGQLNLNDVGAESAKMLSSFFHLGLDLGRETLGLHESGNHADAHTANSVGKVRREVGVHGLARAVERIAAGDGVERVRCVLHRARERTNLIERAAESDHAVAADYAVRGLQRHSTAEAARLANGAARIASERHRGKARCHCRRAAA